MKIQLEKRLTELREELEKGQTMLTDLKTKENNLREAMLRIQGAIQVLEEELSRDFTVPDEQGNQEIRYNGS
jgi:chromosome segregation ATPase